MIQPLKTILERPCDGQPAQSIEELYEFNPWPDDKLEKEYRQVVAAVWTAWTQAEKQFASRIHAYDIVTTVSEEVRLQSTGYAGFKMRFEAFAAFLDGKRADDRALFQLLKWSRDVLRPHTAVKGRQTQTRDASISYLDHEIYFHVVFAVYLHAIQQKNFARQPEGFTATEQAFSFGPLKPVAKYYSNFMNRLKLVFPGDGHPSDVPAFTTLASVYSQLILFARSQHLELVSDERALEIQATIEAAPWHTLVTQRFSTAGMSTWPYAQDTFRRGQRIGTDIRIAYFEGTRPTSVYLQLDAAPGFLFEASLSAFVRKVETGLYDLLWKNNQGLIVLMQKLFEVVGYLPVLIEAGFVGLIEQVAKDQMIAAGLDEVSEAVGKDLSILGMVAPLFVPSMPKRRGALSSERKARAELAVDGAYAQENALAMAGDEAKLLNRLTPSRDAGAAKVASGALTQGEGRAAKVVGPALAPEERQAAKLAARPPTEQEQRVVKAIERHPDPDNYRMAGGSGAGDTRRQAGAAAHGGRARSRPKAVTMETATQERMRLHHGTEQTGYQALGPLDQGRIDVRHAAGAHQDLGQGFYLTMDAETGSEYAFRRGTQRGGGLQHVLTFEIPKSDLGVIVDIRPGGNFRAQWEAFLNERPPLRGGFTPPGFETNRGMLRLAPEHRGTVFEAFLSRHGIQEADTIIASLGDDVFTGITNPRGTTTTQVCIRSQRVADRLNEQIRTGRL